MIMLNLRVLIFKIHIKEMSYFATSFRQKKMSFQLIVFPAVFVKCTLALRSIDSEKESSGGKLMIL